MGVGKRETSDQYSASAINWPKQVSHQCLRCSGLRPGLPRLEEARGAATAHLLKTLCIGHLVLRRAPPLLPPLLAAPAAAFGGPRCIGVSSKVPPVMLAAKICKGAKMEIPQLQGGQLVQDGKGKFIYR